ncbi:MAG: hypothetical protein CMJ50_08555 [Planctomycetaceae bacterium]|nr:hypothetical protein [Planctomycetaceae bacterium]
MSNGDGVGGLFRPSASTDCKSWPEEDSRPLSAINSPTKLNPPPYDGHKMSDNEASSTTSIGLWQCGQQSCIVEDIPAY